MHSQPSCSPLRLPISQLNNSLIDSLERMIKALRALNKQLMGQIRNKRIILKETEKMAEKKLTIATLKLMVRQ